MSKFKSKNLKVVFLMMLLISISLFTTALQFIISCDMYGILKHSDLLNKDNKIFADNFYESARFDGDFLKNLTGSMALATSNKDQQGGETKEDARDYLNTSTDIKFIVQNNSTNEVYTNTSYKTTGEFNKKQKGYCKVEINFDNNNLYSKTINGKKSSVKIDKDLFEEISTENIVINITFPDEPKNSDDGGYFDSTNFKVYYFDFTYYKNIFFYIIMILVSSIIIGIISFVLYRKRKVNLIDKDKLFFKFYNRIPLEIHIGILGVLAFLSFIIIHSIPFGISFILPSIAKFIFLLLVYIWIINFKRLDNKKDIFKSSLIIKVYKLSLSIVVNTVKYQKKFPIIKKLIIIDIILIVVQIGIMNVVYYNYYWNLLENHTTLLIFIIGGGLFLVTGYIINKLPYLDTIIEGTQRIKNGEVNHKIEIKGNDSFTILAENINNLSAGLDKAIDEKFKSERMKTELITNVSHDLKTPLTSIINYVDLIKKEDDIQPEYLKDYVDVLDNKSKRLKILIEDLFEASKASSGNIELNIEKLDLNQLLRQSIGENEKKLSNSNLNLKVNITKEPVYINCDGRRMYRVFENLLINIAKYSLSNTRVYIDMKEDDDNVYLSMKNISSYELNFEACEIIERFKRGDLARNTEGSGLGLSIARDLVELQGGKFDVQIDGDLFKVELVFTKAKGTVENLVD